MGLHGKGKPQQGNQGGGVAGGVDLGQVMTYVGSGAQARQEVAYGRSKKTQKRGLQERLAQAAVVRANRAEIDARYAAEGYVQGADGIWSKHGN